MNAIRTKLIQLEKPIGTKKVSNWKLPSKDFSYGLLSRRDREGVSEITRSWLIHKPSKTAQPPQDFIRINKLSVKMNANNFSTNKDFREHIDIKQKIKVGTKDHQINLPPKDFAYGMHNRAPTPVKEVINFEYGNIAENTIIKDYKTYLKQRKKFSQLVSKTTKHYQQLIKSKNEEKKVREKELYKMKMFQNVGSKVTEQVKQFKTNNHKLKSSKSLVMNKSSIDIMIDKMEKEIKENEILHNSELV